MMKAGLFLLLNSFHLLLIHTNGITLKLVTRQEGAHIIVQVDPEQTVTGKLESQNPVECLIMETRFDRIPGPAWLRLINQPPWNQYKLSEISNCTPSINYTVTAGRLTLDVTHQTEGDQSVQVLFQCEDNQVLMYNDRRETSGQLSASWMAPSLDATGWVRDHFEYEVTVSLTCEDENVSTAKTTLTTAITTQQAQQITPMTTTITPTSIATKVTRQRTSTASKGNKIKGVANSKVIIPAAVTAVTVYATAVVPAIIIISILVVVHGIRRKRQNVPRDPQTVIYTNVNSAGGGSSAVFPATSNRLRDAARVSNENIGSKADSFNASTQNEQSHGDDSLNYVYVTSSTASSPYYNPVAIRRG